MILAFFCGLLAGVLLCAVTFVVGCVWYARRVDRQTAAAVAAIMRRVEQERATAPATPADVPVGCVTSGDGAATQITLHAEQFKFTRQPDGRCES